jgi:acetyl esterase/lipase
MLSASAEFVPRNARERIVAPLLRLTLRLALKPVLSPDVPIARQRHRVERLARLARPRSAVAIEPAIVDGVPGEWLRAPDTNAQGTILYLHGGGYCIGSAVAHRTVTMHLAHLTRASVFAADYRLAPEHPHPAAREDALAAYRALAAQGPVVLAGDSAGGGLALATALAARERKPAALVLFSPWIDLAAARGDAPPGETMLSARWLAACARHYLGAAALVSPLDADLAGLPPTLIQAGIDELLHADAVLLHDALETAGVAVRCEIVPGRWHCFQLHAGSLPSADAALARAGAFIRAALNSVRTA